jgi:hypothetical protein
MNLNEKSSFTLKELDKIIKKEYSPLNDYVKFFKLDGNKLFYLIGEDNKNFQTVYFNVEKKSEDDYELTSIWYYYN